MSTNLPALIEKPNTDILTSTALTPIGVFGKEGGAEDVLRRIEEEARAAKRDISTEKGRAAIRSLAFKIARSKTALDAMGKTITDSFRAKAEVVHVERRTIIARLDALGVEIRKPLTDWEEAEKARIKAHEDALEDILARADLPAEPSVADVEERLAMFDAPGFRDWQEFAMRAKEATEEALGKLHAHMAEAARRERREREEARLDAERVEAARVEAARLQAEREERIVTEAAETARKAAEAAAAEAAATALREAEEREAAVVREREEATRRAEEAERAAAQAVVDAANAAAEAERLRIEREEEDAARAERDRVAAIQKAADDAKHEEERKRLREMQEAENIRLEAARLDGIETAKREAAEAEAAALAQNKAHRTTCNRLAVAQLVLTGITEEQARAVLKAVVLGNIPRVTMTY